MKYGALKILKKEKSKKGSTKFISFTHNVDPLRFFSHYKNVKLNRNEFLSVIHLLEKKKFDLSAHKNEQNISKKLQNFLISHVMWPNWSMKINIFENWIPFSFKNSVIHVILKYQISNIGALNILKKGRNKKGSTNLTNFTHNVESLRLFLHHKKCQTEQDWVSFSHSLAWKNVWFISRQKWKE